MIDHNHPAVEAAARNAYERAWGSEREPWTEVDDLERDEWRADTAYTLTAALEHYPADDLRDTPAGRELMAEGWDRGAADNERGWIHIYDGHVVDPDDPLGECQTCCTPNPYREEIPND